MSNKVIGKSIFIGNIPYGISEEQIVDIFSRVGAVNSFRLVHDKETGRPKGFGFLEFTDVDTAAAAVRNLNDFEIQGRKLRVDWSNDSSASGGQQGAADATGPAANGVDAQGQGALPPLPPGRESNLAAPDAISQTLSAMPAPALLDLISQMKGMVAENPAQVTQLFTVAPQLAYAIFQALLLLGLTDTSVLSSIVQAAQPQQLQQPQQPRQPQYSQPPPPPPQAQPPSSYGTYPAYQQQTHVPTPPVAHPAYAPPPSAAPAPQQDQAALIQQLLAMSVEQIFALPAQQRDQIIQLRAQLGAPIT